MSIDFSVIRPKEKIEIAVSTETILYAPFYIAYYNDDFNDAPYCSLEVVIVGTKEDLRFDTTKKLKGDGFATFAVLLGLADAAICDPSYLIYLNSCTLETLTLELDKFQELLLPETKSSIVQKKEFEECLQIINGALSFKKIELFQRNVLKKYTKIIGGLVSKIAFDAIGSQDLLALGKDLNGGGLGKLMEDQTTHFGENYISNFICYHNPSTGYCVGNIFYEKYHKAGSDKLQKNETDFGFELDPLTLEAYEPGEQGWVPKVNHSFHANSVAFSCDFIAIDFLLDKHNYGKNKQILAVDNLAYDNTSYMFTGILGNTRPENDAKLEALLYGIDYNLFKIDSYLKNVDTTGLIQYLKKKLRYTDGKQDLLLDLLIASPLVKARVRDKIRNDPHYSFDTVLRYYVERLVKWKAAGSLYYADTTPNKADLEQILQLRYSCTNLKKTIQLDEFIKKDYLTKFRKREAKYWSLEQFSFKLRGKKVKRTVNTILLAILPFLRSITLIKSNLAQKSLSNIEAVLWSIIRRPLLLYIFATLFIYLEIVSSLFHIFHVNFNLDKLLFTTEEQILLPGEGKLHFTVERFFPIGHLVFYVFLWYILVILWFARDFLKLKQESKYYYRNPYNEQN